MAHGHSTKEAISRIVSELEKRIIFGSLLPRQRLYEDEFIAYFNTKRHIVRGALEELERRGIVERIPNRGSVVCFFSRQDVEDLYTVRAILHEAGAKLIKLPPTPEWLGELRAVQSQHSDAVANNDILQVYEANTLFHQKLYQGTENAFLVEAIENSNAKTHGIRSHGLGSPKLLRRAEKEHLGMIDAAEAGDLDKLAQLCIAHMQPARKFYEEKYIAPISFSD